MDAESNVSRADDRTINAAAIGSFPPANDNCRSNRTNSAARQKNNYHLRLCHRRTGETSWRRCDARHAPGAPQSASRGNHAHESVLPHPGNVAPRCDESGTCSALSSVSSLRKNGTAPRPLAWPDAVGGRGDRIKRATGRDGRRRKRGAPYHAMGAEPEISASLASGKFILRVTCCGRGGFFSGNDRPHHCAG